MLKDLDGQLAIHFPGRRDPDKPHVLVYSNLKACLNCGHVEFVLSDEQLEQVKNGVFPAHWWKSASGQ